MQLLFAAAQIHTFCYLTRVRPRVPRLIAFDPDTLDELIDVFIRFLTFREYNGRDARLRDDPQLEHALSDQAERDAARRIAAYAAWAPPTLSTWAGLARLLERAVGHLRRFEEWSRQHDPYTPSRARALAMALQPRLGAASALGALPPDLVRRVADPLGDGLAAALPRSFLA